MANLIGLNLTPYAIVWVVLGLVVAGLALMRKQISQSEDDSIHLGGDATIAAEHQLVIAKKLEGIDRWGKLLTIVLVVTGVILGILYALQLWDSTSKVGLS
jgi:hypothetical protein